MKKEVVAELGAMAAILSLVVVVLLLMPLILLSWGTTAIAERIKRWVTQHGQHVKP